MKVNKDFLGSFKRIHSTEGVDIELEFELKTPGVIDSPCGSGEFFYNPEYRLAVLDVVTMFKKLNLISENDSIAIYHEDTFLENFLNSNEVKSGDMHSNIRFVLDEMKFTCLIVNAPIEELLWMHKIEPALSAFCSSDNATCLIC